VVIQKLGGKRSVGYGQHRRDDLVILKSFNNVGQIETKKQKISDEFRSIFKISNSDVKISTFKISKFPRTSDLQ
jgi:hypothetical protein